LGTNFEPLNVLYFRTEGVLWEITEVVAFESGDSAVETAHGLAACHITTYQMK
jgi:hypothetical protein